MRYRLIAFSMVASLLFATALWADEPAFEVIGEDHLDVIELVEPVEHEAGLVDQIVGAVEGAIGRLALGATAEVDLVMAADELESKVVRVPLEDSGYWIGIQLVPVPPALTAHLKLEDGALVQSVITESPAAKAGVRSNDVLIRVGEKPVKKTTDLSAALKESDGNEVTVVILQEGEKKTIKIKPEKRPETTSKTMVFTTLKDAEKAMNEVAKKMQDSAADYRKLAEGQAKEIIKLKGSADEYRKMAEAEAKEIAKAATEAVNEYRLQVVRPGVAVPGGSFVINRKSAELPGDVTVKISKQGKQPAEVEVRKGDQSWTVNEDGLDKLPEEVRPHVERMLGRGPALMEFRGPDVKFKSPAVILRGEAQVQTKRAPESKSSDQGKIDQKLDTMARTLDQLRRELEELRKANR